MWKPQMIAPSVHSLWFSLIVFLTCKGFGNCIYSVSTRKEKKLVLDQFIKSWIFFAMYVCNLVGQVHGRYFCGYRSMCTQQTASNVWGKSCKMMVFWFFFNFFFLVWGTSYVRLISQKLGCLGSSLGRHEGIAWAFGGRGNWVEAQNNLQ